MIAVCEGGDASGKKTQAGQLTALLNFRARELDLVCVETFDFPRYQGTAGGLVGRIIKGETLIAAEGDFDPDSPANLEWLRSLWSNDKALIIQSVMLADRCEHSSLLRRYAKGGQHFLDGVLVLDRYYMSGIVYSQVDGLDRGWLEDIHEVLPRADLFCLLDVDVEEGFKRRPERLDYYEKNKDKQLKVREVYLTEFLRRGGSEPDTYHILDGMEPAATITQRIFELVKGKLEMLRYA